MLGAEEGCEFEAILIRQHIDGAHQARIDAGRVDDETNAFACEAFEVAFAEHVDAELHVGREYAEWKDQKPKDEAGESVQVALSVRFGGSLTYNTAMLTRTLALILGIAAIAGAAPTTQDAESQTRPYDLLITNGRIIDGSGNAWFYGDVAVHQGKIAAVGTLKDARAARTIDAAKRVVAPGFIDVHTHVDNDILKSPNAENFVRDGVATIVCGNCGGSESNIARFFEQVREKGAAVNVATLYGHNTVLRAVRGDKGGKLEPEQMSNAKELVRQAMRDGAVGFSTGLIYTPGTYSPTEDIIELAKAAAEFGGIYATHMRNEATGILDAIDEALRIGREAGCRVEISHFKLPSDVARKIGGAQTTIGKVMEARGAGQEVWIDQYPYTASSTSISTLLPDWVLENGADEAKKTLKDPEQIARVVKDMHDNYEVKRGRKSMAYAVLTSCRGYPDLAGRDLKTATQILKLRKSSSNSELLKSEPEKLPPVTMEEQYRAVIDIYLAGGAGCVFHTMDEQEVIDILKHPLVSIASDSGIRTMNIGQPHPRGYGTNARVLGHYVRELKLIPLEEAIRKMTSMPATAFRFDDRGLLREGFAADIAIFDPEKVIDKATFEKPHQFAEGIDCLIVSGGVVMEEGKLTGTLSGSVIEGPGTISRRAN
jgi:N-acyl-D-amino-acid deacylase